MTNPAHGRTDPASSLMMNNSNTKPDEQVKFFQASCISPSGRTYPLGLQIQNTMGTHRAQKAQSLIKDKFIKKSQDFTGLKVIITGGDANSFDKRLKSSIFVVSHLNLIGLNRILDYNAWKKNEE